MKSRAADTRSAPELITELCAILLLLWPRPFLRFAFVSRVDQSGERIGCDVLTGAAGLQVAL